jgi:hypothetical protein
MPPLSPLRQQLTTRYSTGLSGQNAGGLIIYKHVRGLDCAACVVCAAAKKSIFSDQSHLGRDRRQPGCEIGVLTLAGGGHRSRVTETSETYFGSACVNDFDLFDARASRDCTSDKPGASGRPAHRN